jgi:hypothetical protein
MGLYTDYWAQHKRHANKSTLQALATLGLGLPAVAGLGYLLSPLTDLGTALLLAAVMTWVIALTSLVLRGSKVVCPRCFTRYSRGKFLVNCPKCGLRMFQEDP